MWFARLMTSHHSIVCNRILKPLIWYKINSVDKIDGIKLFFPYDNGLCNQSFKPVMGGFLLNHAKS